MLQEITLPAGRVIELENLPQGMTKARLKELLIRNNKATEEDFFVPVTEDVDKRRGLGATGEGVDVGQFFKENLDIPAGIAGAVTGAKLAAPTLNPWLIGASAVAGGAVGTFSGSLASDWCRFGCSYSRCGTFS